MRSFILFGFLISGISIHSNWAISNDLNIDDPEAQVRAFAEQFAEHANKIFQVTGGRCNLANPVLAQLKTETERLQKEALHFIQTTPEPCWKDAKYDYDKFGHYVEISPEVPAKVQTRWLRLTHHLDNCFIFTTTLTLGVLGYFVARPDFVWTDLFHLFWVAPGSIISNIAIYVPVIKTLKVLHKSTVPQRLREVFFSIH